MTLQQLGAQYLQQEEVLRKKLQQIKEQTKQEWKPGEDTLLQRRMYYLNAEAAECHRIGMYLLHYGQQPRADQGLAC